MDAKNYRTFHILAKDNIYGTCPSQWTETHGTFISGYVAMSLYIYSGIAFLTRFMCTALAMFVCIVGVE